MHRSRVREWLANSVLVIGSIFLALVLAEVSLRVAGFSYPTIWRFDSITGKSLLPGAEMWNHEEGHALIRINSDGLRDREHAIEKPNSTLRIAILGDSYAEAVQVPGEKAFWSILEKKLAGCPKLQGKQVEAINFGVSGFGTVQELLTLRHKVWKYSPDIVVLAFLTGNDIRNNTRELQRGGNQPYFIYQDGKLVLDDSYLDKAKSRLRGSILGDWWFASLAHSRTLQLLVKFGNYLDQRKNVEQREARKNARRVHERGLNLEIYSPPTEPAWIEAWNVTEDLLRMMNADISAHDATFFLVTLSNADQVNPDPVKRQQVAASLNVNDLLYPDRRIQRLAEEENIRFVMLVPPLQAWAEQHGRCVHGFENATPCGGHWNEEGHRLVGNIIAENICRSRPQK
jgi:hypothetical protein